MLLLWWRPWLVRCGVCAHIDGVVVVVGVVGVAVKVVDLSVVVVVVGVVVIVDVVVGVGAQIVVVGLVLYRRLAGGRGGGGGGFVVLLVSRLPVSVLLVPP